MTDVNDLVGVDGAAVEALDAVDEQLLTQLTDHARAEGLRLVGEGGLLARSIKRVVESAIEGVSWTIIWATAPARHRAGSR